MVLRKSLLVSTDELLAVVREFLNPEVSRSGLDRGGLHLQGGDLSPFRPSAPDEGGTGRGRNVPARHGAFARLG